MPTNEEGEFELVLGNKQLLSVFFLVVLLLAVFFSMGYLAGRYTAPVTVAGMAPPDPIAVGGGSPPDIEKPPATPVEPAEPSTPQPAKPEPTPPPVSTAPVKPEPKPEPPKPEPPKPEPPKPEPPPTRPPVAPVSAGALVRGSYLQVAATKAPDADRLIQNLAAKGFRAAKMPVPDSALVRVLVGPIASGDVPQTKAKLKLSGFDSIPRNIN
ncbi:MAG: SPOR domain-containing protein [Bryobacteraceae bacterium]